MPLEYANDDFGRRSAQYAEELRAITGIRAAGHATLGRNQQRTNLRREVVRNAVESRLDPIVVSVNSKWMDVWMVGLGRRQLAVQGQPDRSDLRQSRRGNPGESAPRPQLEQQPCQRSRSLAHFRR